MEKLKKNNSSELASSYMPEIRTFGGQNPFAKALLTLADEFLLENRKNVERLPEKHKAEFFARLSETLQMPQPGAENFFCVFGVIEPVASESSVLIKKDSEWAGEETTCRLTEDFQVSGAVLKKIILTNAEKQNYIVAYDGGEDFEGVDFPACFKMENGDFSLYFNCKNMPYNISRREIWFYADDLDSDVYANSETAEWFIQSGEETVSMNAKIIQPNVLALKAKKELNLETDDVTIGVRISNNAFLPRCNFTNPLFSFGMGTNLKPDLIIRSGEAREMPFYPFGYPLEEKSDFFVACNEAFSIRGAKVVLRVDLRFEEFYRPYEPHLTIDMEALFENNEEYAGVFKVAPPEEKKCKADKVSFQYFNGERFVLLPESGIHETLFSGGKIHEFLFTIPDDMEICEIGGAKSYWLRVCLEETGDLYYRPCKMLCPQINDIKISYGASLEPAQVKRVTAAGTKYIPSDGSGDVIYENCYGEEPCFYMGFDGTLNEGKLTLFIDTDRACGIPAVSGEWEALTKDGFTSVDAVDGAECFAYSGRVVFDIPKGVKKCETGFSEESLYWLRTPVMTGLSRYPEIKAIYVNAAEFSLNGNCSKGDAFVLEDGNYQGFKAAAVTNSRKPERGGSEEEWIKYKISNTGLMVSEADIRKTLLMNFPELEEIKCAFDNNRNMLSIFLKFKAPDQEECFNGYTFFIKKILAETCNYEVELLRPVKVFISVRAAVNRSEPEAGLLREKLGTFLDFQSGGYNSRGWKIGELPNKNTIRRFFEKNGVKADDLVVSAGVYDKRATKDKYRECVISDLLGKGYVSAAGEISLIGEKKG